MSPRLLSPLAVALTFAASASAQTRADGASGRRPAAGTEATDACAQREATALGQVACELGRDLSRACCDAASGAAPGTPEAWVVATTKVSAELGPEKQAELGERLARLLVGALGARASARPGIVGWPTVVAEARGARVVALTVELDRTRIAVSADLLAARTRFWERLAAPTPPVVAHAFAARALDPELRAFLPRVPLVLSKVHRATLDEPAVAVACGDLDADGSPEIAVVGRQRAHVGRVVAGAFRPSVSAQWPALSPLASTPLREPIASAAIGSNGNLIIGSTDRDAAVVLDAGLRVIARHAGRLPWGSDGCAQRVALGLASEPVPCAGVARTASTELVDAVAAAPWREKSGRTVLASAARRQSDGRVRVRIGARSAELEPAGAQLALGDLDGDGQLELVTTSPSSDPSQDFLAVRTLRPDGKTAPGPRVNVPTGVRALAICPPGPRGFAPIVAATGDGLWILE